MRHYVKKTERAKRGKHKGSVELRGNVYIARWCVNGKRYAETTGQTDKQAAYDWIERRLAEIAASDIHAATRKKKDTLRQQRLALATLKGGDVKADEDEAAALAELPTVAISEIVKRYEAALESAGKIEAEFARLRERYSDTSPPRTRDALRAEAAASLTAEDKEKLVAVAVEARSFSAVANYANHLRQFAAWVKENHPEIIEANDVTANTAKEYGDALAAKFNPSTRKVHLVGLGRVWNVLAEKEPRIKANPWYAVKREPSQPGARRELTRDELAKIAATLKGEMLTAFFIGCFTGLRMSDAVNLTWEQIDLANHEINVKPIKTARHGQYVAAPIVPEFFAILATVPAAKRRGLLTPGLAAEYNTENKRGALSKRFVTAFAAAGIETQTKTGKGENERARNVVGFHSLRHTYVSIAANAGIPLETVQAVVGHSATRMTEHYFHANRAAVALAYEKFPTLFGKAAPAQIWNGGDVIDAEVVIETGAATTAAADFDILATLEKTLAQIVATGDADRRKAAADILAKYERELATK